MATLVNKTIKSSGGDYPTLEALFADTQDLISADEYWVVTVDPIAETPASTLTLTGWNTDSTRYLKIIGGTAPTTPGSVDTNAYNCTVSGSCLIITNCGSAPLVIFENMQFIASNITLQGGYIGTTTTGEIRFVNSNLICTGAQRVCSCSTWATDLSNNFTFYNCALRNNGNEYVFRANNSGNDHILYYCTLINATTGTAKGVYGPYGNVTVKNSYYGTTGTLSAGFEAGPSYTSCWSSVAADKTAGRTDGTAAYNSSLFSVVTAGSEDLHLVSGTSLEGAATAIAEVTTDFDGETRDELTPDVGLDEYGAPPICWNYTARYCGSHKHYKVGGCGSFPRKLNVPTNIDTSTGRLIDDGRLIDPDEYEIS